MIILYIALGIILARILLGLLIFVGACLWALIVAFIEA